MAKLKETDKKEHKPADRYVANEKNLKDAQKKLPDSDTHAWYKIIAGGGTYHNLTSLRLANGHFVYLPKKLADQAKGIYKLAKTEAVRKEEVK